MYRVAARYQLRVILVSNMHIQTPYNNPLVQLVVVSSDPDAADDWIADHIQAGDICITADIPLAARCLERDAEALGPRGKPFSQDSIGDALAMRELMSDLRETGVAGGGPPPFDKKDRSRFLNVLDQVIQRVRREAR